MNEINRYRNCNLDEKRTILGHAVQAYADLGNQNKSKALGNLNIAVGLWGANEYRDVLIFKRHLSDDNLGMAKGILLAMIQDLILDFSPSSNSNQTE